MLIVATPVFEDLQVTWVVRSCLVPSEKLPIAVYCSGTRTGAEMLVGDTTSVWKVAVDTVSAAVAVVPFHAAVMVTEPAALAVARPRVGLVLLMVATVMFDDVQTADVVTSKLDPSLNEAVAANCRVVPRAIWVVAGEITKVDSVAVETVSVVVSETPPSAAVMTAAPAATAFAAPFDPAALLIVAAAVFDEDQVTRSVMSWVDPSE